MSEQDARWHPTGAQTGATPPDIAGKLQVSCRPGGVGQLDDGLAAWSTSWGLAARWNAVLGVDLSNPKLVMCRKRMPRRAHKACHERRYAHAKD